MDKLPTHRTSENLAKFDELVDALFALDDEQPFASQVTDDEPDTTPNFAGVLKQENPYAPD